MITGSAGQKVIILEDTFTIEEIYDRQKQNKYIKYLIKWKDYVELTWEPKINLYKQKNLVEQYDTEYRQYKKTLSQKKKTWNQYEQLINQTGNMIEGGSFTKGDIFDKILSVRKEEENIVFIVSWKPRGGKKIIMISRVSNDELRKQYPKSIVDYYEKIMKVEENKWY